VSGECQVASCNAGFGNCNGDPTDGCETVLSNDRNNCGACGLTCTSANGTPACGGGVCSVACNAGFADCDANPTNGCETHVSSDPNSCGVCHLVCPGGNGTPSCGGGECAIACAAGFANCDGCEIALGADPTNCGACGLLCSAPNGTPACSGGACQVASCQSGFGNCDGNAANGCETVLATNPNNCGACGHVCAVAHGTPACGAGACQVGACAVGFADCNQNAADGCETAVSSDAANCGACGAACAGGQTCVMSHCQ
jgi:hypothetical protein